jgi:hypothetical protein
MIILFVDFIKIHQNHGHCALCQGQKPQHRLLPQPMLGSMFTRLQRVSRVPASTPIAEQEQQIMDIDLAVPIQVSITILTGSPRANQQDQV